MTWPGLTAHHSSWPTVLVGGTLVPHQATWEHTGADGHPDASIRYEMRGGRPECVEIVIRAKPTGREVRTSDVATLHLESLAIGMFTSLGLPVDRGDLIGDPPEQRAKERDVHSARTSRRGAVTREVLEDIARTYRANIDTAPVQIIAERHGLTPRTAARRVEQARAAGLLPKTEKGKRKA